MIGTGRRAPRKLPPTGSNHQALDEARARLGGRAETDPQAGRIVTLPSVSAGGARRAVVVVHAGAGALHVLVDGQTVRRVPAADAQEPDGRVPARVRRLASELQVFATLHEGEPVRFVASRGRLEDAVLVEKCRYGALVRRGDGRTMAVGFRRLWPAAVRGQIAC